MNFTASPDNTNFIRGAVILTVYINHLINVFYTKAYTGYANGFIAFFFLISGYGICLSNVKFYNFEFFNFTNLFFKKRFLRIYPLFWIWCAVTIFSNGALGFLGLDFIYPKSPWFVPAIIQCYLITPVLFFLLKYLKNYQFLLLSIALFFVFNLFFYIWKGVPVPTIGYKGLYFSHIMLYCFGFFIALIKYDFNIYKKYTLLVFLLYLFILNETTNKHFLNFIHSEILFSILFLFFSILLFILILQLNFKFVLSNIFIHLGVYSYSIYLFHLLFFDLFAHFFEFNTHVSFFSNVFFVIFITYFILISCCLIEAVVNYFVLKNSSSLVEHITNVIKVFLPSRKREVVSKF